MQFSTLPFFQNNFSSFYTGQVTTIPYFCIRGSKRLFLNSWSNGGLRLVCDIEWSPVCHYLFSYRTIAYSGRNCKYSSPHNDYYVENLVNNQDGGRQKANHTSDSSLFGICRHPSTVDPRYCRLFHMHSHYFKRYFQQCYGLHDERALGRYSYSTCHSSTGSTEVVIIKCYHYICFRVVWSRKLITEEEFKYFDASN